MLFLFDNHIVDNKIYAQICLFVVTLNGSGMRVCYDCDGLCTLVDIPLKFHRLMSYILLVFRPSKLVIDNFSSSNKFIEVELKYFNVHCLEFWKFSHTRNESLVFISLTLEFSCIIITMTKVILLIYMSPIILWLSYMF
jgi:hypothetical protein